MVAQSNRPAAAEPTLGVLIVSCDRYSDTWQPLLASFDRYWPDCPYPISLLSNELAPEHDRIRSVRVGPDVDWSTNLLRALDVLEYTHVLLWIDDVFPARNIDSATIARLFSFVATQGAAFMRMRPEPEPRRWRPDGLGELDPDALYRVSVFGTIWRVDVLRQVLRGGESPWQFELDGTERARNIPGFYCTRQWVFGYVHGIEKGIWLRRAVKWLRRNGHRVDLERRRQMTRGEHLAYKLGRIKYWTLRGVPERHRKRVLRLAGAFYKAVGLR